MPTKTTRRGETRKASTSKRTVRSRAVQQDATTQHARQDVWRKLFVAQLKVNGNVTRAAQTAEIERSTAYRLREQDATFRADWDEAIEMWKDRLEEEADRRAREGTLKAVFYKGQVVGFENEYSDTLMQTLLKAARPEKYKERIQIDIPEINKAMPILQELLLFLRENNQDFTEAQRQFLAMLRAQKEAAHNA